MTAYDRHRPQDAPATIIATADGKTVLHRYRVEAVIYAPTRIDALLRLEHGAVYLDAARLLRDEPDEPEYVKGPENGYMVGPLADEPER